MQIAQSDDPTYAKFLTALSGYKPTFQAGGAVCRYCDLCWEEQETGDLISAETETSLPPAVEVRHASEILATVAEKASTRGPEVESVAKRALLRFRTHAAEYNAVDPLTDDDRACVSAMVSAAVQNVLKSQEMRTKNKVKARVTNAISRILLLFKRSGRGKTGLGVCWGPTATA